MNALHRDIAPHVRIVDPSVSIMYCIGLADLLVSDESSVLLEASLYGVPSLAITDWTIPDTHPPRPACVPFENVRKEPKASLRDSVLRLLNQTWDGTAEAKTLRELHFTRLGSSSQTCADILLSLLDGKQPDHPRIHSEAGERVVAQRSTFQHGLSLMQAGDIRQSIEIFRTLASQNTDLWQVYFALGEHALTSGQLEAALIFHETAIQKTHGAELRPVFAYATVQARLGNWKAALDVYGQILKTLPSHPQTLPALSAMLACAEKIPADLWQKLLKEVQASGRTLG
jgi:tetratricopeptide (TPR) repeat protein